MQDNPNAGDRGLPVGGHGGDQGPDGHSLPQAGLQGTAASTGIHHFLFSFSVVNPSDPDPLLFCMDPDSDPSINKQKKEENLDFYYFVSSF